MLSSKCILVSTIYSKLLDVRSMIAASIDVRLIIAAFDGPNTTLHLKIDFV